jgi:radical SAM protein with 4Fe4S-binding SPASM domain
MGNLYNYTIVPLFMIKAVYPLLKEDIALQKVRASIGFKLKIYNITTGESIKATPIMFVLLDLCTGTHTLTEIINQVSGQPGNPPEELIHVVENTLTELHEKGVISMSKTPRQGSKIKEISLQYPLEAAQIEITNRCNLQCLHCFNNSGIPRSNELTTKEILSLLDTLSAMGVLHVTFTGGEPFMHPDVFTIIEHARKAPMSVDIFTNGTLITEDMVRKCKKIGIRQFNISVDSVDEAVHDRFRGKKGALRKTLHTIELLKEAGFAVKISISLSQLNKDKIVDMFKYFKENNLQDFDMMPVRYSGRGVSGLAVSLDEYYCSLIEQFTYLKKEFPDGITKIHERKQEACSIGRDSIGIKSDGTVIPCPGCDRGPYLGNVRDIDLKKVWEDCEMLGIIRNTTTQTDKTCKNCKYLRFCSGCIANAFSVEGRIRCYTPYSCVFNRAYDEVIGLIEEKS